MLDFIQHIGRFPRGKPVKLKKRFVIILFAVLAVAWFVPSPVRADMGPKPSVVVDFPDVPRSTYYVTLLSEAEITGPYRVVDADEAATYEGQTEEEEEAYYKLATYVDGNGYHFLGHIEECSETNQYSWTYYPPQKFKILVYIPSQSSEGGEAAPEQFLHSEILEAYAFDSYYTVTGFERPLLTVRQSYNFGPELLSLFLRIVLTIAIEQAIAWLFRFRNNRVLRLILVVNLFTQIGLNVALNVIAYYGGGLAFIFLLIPLELIVFIVEAIIYARSLPRRSSGQIKGRTAVAYALVANIASLALGWMLARYLPGIF